MGCTKRVGMFRGNNIYANKKKSMSRNKDKDKWGVNEERSHDGSGPMKRSDLQQVRRSLKAFNLGSLSFSVSKTEKIMCGLGVI